MLFPEDDAPLLKTWIVKRLENTSDADADVLADYVLALLHHDDGSEDVKAKCQAEMGNFLTEDASVFVNDLFEAMKYRSYVPGALPPPKPQPAAAPQSILPGLGAAAMLQPTIPNGPAGGGRKRGFQERGDFDAPNGREQFQGGRSSKQPRRGGRFGGPKGYVDPDRPRPPQQQEQFGYPNAPASNAPPFLQPGQALSMPQLDLNNPMEAMRQLQQLSQQMGLQMPPFPDYSQQQGYQQQRVPQQGRKKCWDYEKKGYCPRGLNCKFVHSTGTEPMYNNLPAPQASGQIQLPSEGLFGPPLYHNAPSGNGGYFSQAGSPASLSVVPFFGTVNNMSGIPGLTQQVEYDPNSATAMQAPQMPQFPMQPISAPSNGYNNNHNRENRHGQSRQRMGGSRAPFSAEGPVHDRTQTKVVVESIPEENFDEEQIRGFFSQFGNIEEVTMMPYKRLAIVKYDNWGSANAAYKSPKVIFDNRFVKVFWYKEEKHAELANGGNGANGTKNSATANGNSGSDPAEVKMEDIDMEEFTRKQEEAQKAHDEKMKKKQEIEQQRAELEKKQKELQAKQEAEKQRLLAKIASSSRKNSTGPAGDASSGAEAKEKDGNTSKTDALKATLAKLQEEANALGIDPDAMKQEDDDAMMSTYAPGYNRGGRGGYFRGRGGITPRASFRGAARGGRGNIQAAYAAFSLDNRPRKVAVSGVDFSTPEKDEALRRHLFVLGEGSAEIQVTPAVTHVNFSDRKSAETFYFSLKNKKIQGIDSEVELAWVANTAGPLPNSTTKSIDLGMNATNGNEDGGGHGGDDALDSEMADASKGAVDQTVGGPGQQEVKETARDLDYDVAGDNEWDIT